MGKALRVLILLALCAGAVAFFVLRRSGQEQASPDPAARPAAEQGAPVPVEEKYGFTTETAGG